MGRKDPNLSVLAGYDPERDPRRNFMRFSGNGGGKYSPACQQAFSKPRRTERCTILAVASREDRAIEKMLPRFYEAAMLSFIHGYDSLILLRFKRRFEKAEMFDVLPRKRGLYFSTTLKFFALFVSWIRPLCIPIYFLDLIILFIFSNFYARGHKMNGITFELSFSPAILISGLPV